jgi:protein TonB
MLGSNLDIMNEGWLNLVFANRNKAYGAYQLRQDNARNTNKAMLIAISGFVILIAVPTIANMLSGHTTPPIERRIDFDDKIYVIKHEIAKPIEVPKAQPAQQLKNTVIRNPEYKPVKDELAEEPPKQSELAKAEIGTKNIEGNDKGAINTGQDQGTSLKPVTPGPTQPEAAGNGNEILPIAENEPMPIGGMDKFYTFLGNKIKYPNGAKDAGAQGRVILTFVVEKDGSLTDIKAVKDPGYGLADEAIRVLKLSPKWKPGSQNGRNVRVQYTIPVNFSLGDQ